MTPIERHLREKAVLGGMLMRKSAADDGLAALTEDDFGDSQHRCVFACIKVASQTGRSMDPVAVYAIANGDLSSDTLNELLFHAPDGVGWDEHVHALLNSTAVS